MKKRTVVFGNPVFVLRVCGKVLFVMLLALLVVFVVSYLAVDGRVLSDVIFDNIWIALLVFATLLLVYCMVMWWLSIPLRRFRKKFKELSGRVCFRCGYEIASGLDVCSECGSEWRFTDLNRRWRKRANTESGR